MKQEILVQLEIAIEAAIEKHSDGMIEMLVKKIQDLTPEKLALVDIGLEAMKPELKKHAKAYLLSQAEKIDGQ